MHRLGGYIVLENPFYVRILEVFSKKGGKHNRQSQSKKQKTVYSRTHISRSCKLYIFTME